MNTGGVVVRLTAHRPAAAAVETHAPVLLPDGELTVDAAAGLPDQPPRLPAGARATFDGAVPMAGATYRLRAWADPGSAAQRFRVEVEGIGAFAVAADGRRVRQLSAAGASATAELEAAFGAPLILALALRGVFVLHASAACTASGAAVLLLGPSGAGKSTLAAFLDGAGGWRRLCDDQTPVAAAGRTGCEVRPRFPQLKLPRGAVAGLPERLVSAGAFVLDEGEALAVRRLPPRQGVEELLHHTVAARTFDAPLLASHLEEASRWAAAGVSRLTYPRRREALPAVQEALTAAVHST